MNALFNALTKFPAALKTCETLALWIVEEAKKYRLAQFQKKLQEASVLAKEQKDTSKIDALFKR